MSGNDLVRRPGSCQPWQYSGNMRLYCAILYTPLAGKQLDCNLLYQALSCCCAADPERYQQPHWQSPARGTSSLACCGLWCGDLQRVWQPAGRPAAAVPWRWHTSVQASLHGVLWPAVSSLRQALSACMPVVLAATPALCSVCCGGSPLASVSDSRFCSTT